MHSSCPGCVKLLCENCSSGCVLTACAMNGFSLPPDWSVAVVLCGDCLCCEWFFFTTCSSSVCVVTVLAAMHP